MTPFAFLQSYKGNGKETYINGYFGQLALKLTIVIHCSRESFARFSKQWEMVKMELLK